MAHIDPTTLLYRDLTRGEAEELYWRASNLTVKGEAGDTFTSPLFRMLVDATYGDTCSKAHIDTNAVVVLHTAFPAKALLSYLLWCAENGVAPKQTVDGPKRAPSIDELAKAAEKASGSYVTAAQAVFALLPDGGEPQPRAIQKAKDAAVAKAQGFRLADEQEDESVPHTRSVRDHEVWKAFVKTLLAESALEGGG